MKTFIIAAVAVAALALPAVAAEGNGEPFPNYLSGSTTTTALSQTADVGSEAFPNVAGRPGSSISVASIGIVPETGSEQPIQTANSLPRGFEQGMPAYAHLVPAVPTRLAGVDAGHPHS